MAGKRGRNKGEPASGPEPPRPSGDIVDKAILVLCSGCNPETAAENIGQAFALDANAAKEVIALAQAQIIRAATIDHDRELGQSYYRLNDLYLRSLRIQDTKTALAAQRELNKLLSLYARPSPLAGARSEGLSDDGRLETAIRGYLIPLRLAPEDAPLIDHVRIAASAIIDQQSIRIA